jgi:Rod binding domain-containing protein
METPIGLPPRLLTTAQAPQPGAKSEAELRRIAEEFEAMALNQLLAPMFEGLTTDGLGGGGAGEAMFRPMLVQEYAKGIAQAGGVGLAEPVLRELMKMQAGERPDDGTDRR